MPLLGSSTRTGINEPKMPLGPQKSINVWLNILGLTKIFQKK